MPKLPRGVGSVSQFEILQQVGQGTYGQVFKARHKTTRRMYALKKVRRVVNFVCV